jgi:hypothetical protein
MMSLLRPRRSDGCDGTGLIQADTGFATVNGAKIRGFAGGGSGIMKCGPPIGTLLRGALSAPKGSGQQISEF